MSDWVGGRGYQYLTVDTGAFRILPLHFSVQNTGAQAHKHKEERAINLEHITSLQLVL